MELTSLIKQCGKKNLAGTEIDLWYTCSCELTGFPRTKAVIDGTTVPADTKLLDEPFDFSNAPAGEGYWRHTKVVVDTAAITDTLEGEVGGQAYKNGLPFFLAGTDAENLAFADAMAIYSGCLIFMMKDAMENHRVIGKTGRPASAESIEGTTGLKNGDRRGFAYTMMAGTGLTAPIYNVSETNIIKLTPNV